MRNAESRRDRSSHAQADEIHLPQRQSVEQVLQLRDVERHAIGGCWPVRITAAEQVISQYLQASLREEAKRGIPNEARHGETVNQNHSPGSPRAAELVVDMALIQAYEVARRLATRIVIEVSPLSLPWQADRHSTLPRALSTRSGVKGNSSIQTPVASWIAAAMAGTSGRNGISPRPRAPHGPLGSGTSTMTDSTVLGISRTVGRR